MLSIKDLLDQMVRDSRVYYVPEGLPARKQLLKKLAKEPPEVWRDLSPLQNFFLFETVPSYLNKAAPAEVAQSAYCAALETLPGDWWGAYGRPDSETSRRLMRIEGIEGCLLRQLDNEKRVQMGDSEPATLAKLEKLQVADLAALFLAQKYNLEYPMHRQPEERKLRRNEIRQHIEKGRPNAQ